jgi:hypothetical protein
MTLTLTNHKSTFYAFNLTPEKFTTFSLKVNNASWQTRRSRDSDDGNPRISGAARQNNTETGTHQNSTNIVAFLKENNMLCTEQISFYNNDSNCRHLPYAHF